MTSPCCCSHCGTNGHNSPTCCSPVAVGGGSGEIMLFGVRVKVDPMRKSVSMSNLSQYEQQLIVPTSADAAVANADTGYASADDAGRHQSNGGSRERKRGIPWTEEEHKLFLVGLQKVGKGDWRGISRNFVKTRTPTQVASHAQKYFLRRSNLNRRRRRSSLFDMTTDTVVPIAMEEDKGKEANAGQPVLPPVVMPSQEIPDLTVFPLAPFPVAVAPVLLPVHMENPMESLSLGNANLVNNGSTVLMHAIPVLPLPDASARADLELGQKPEPSPLSLTLSLSLNHGQSAMERHSAFQAMPTFGNGDGIITVA